MLLFSYKWESILSKNPLLRVFPATHYLWKMLLSEKNKRFLEDLWLLRNGNKANYYDFATFKT